MRVPGFSPSRHSGEIWLHGRNFATTIVSLNRRVAQGCWSGPLLVLKIRTVAGDAGADHVDPGLVAQTYGFRKNGKAQSSRIPDEAGDRGASRSAASGSVCRSRI